MIESWVEDGANWLSFMLGAVYLSVPGSSQQIRPHHELIKGIINS